MEAGIAFREIPQKEESGKMNLSFEDDLAHSDNLSCSTCERDIRPIPSEPNEACLLAGLSEIELEGLLMEKEQESTLNLDMDDPVIEENFQRISQTNWLFDTLHRTKLKPEVNEETKDFQCERQLEQSRAGDQWKPSSIEEGHDGGGAGKDDDGSVSKDSLAEETDVTEEVCSEEEISVLSEKGPTMTKLQQYPWMGDTLLQILGDSFVTRLQETKPALTPRRLSDGGVSVSFLSSTHELASIESAESDDTSDSQKGRESTLDLNSPEAEEEQVPLLTSSIIDIDNILNQEEDKREDEGVEDGPKKEENAKETPAAAPLPHPYIRRLTLQHSQSPDPLPIQPFLDIDNTELTERFNKIVSAFGDKQRPSFTRAPWLPYLRPTEETDSGGDISMDKMMTVIKRLDREDNWFHYFMNALPMIGKRNNKEEHEELLAEMQDINPTGSGKITLNQFKIYNAKHLKQPPPPAQTEDRRPSWKRISLKWREKKRASDKLLKYFRAIAEAKKMTFTPTRVVFPLLVLLIMGIHIYVKSQESHRSHQLRDVLQFDTAKHEEVWRYFTYSLLHANGEHIVVNLSLLLFVGFSMELIHGTLRPLLVYVLGVVTSSMFFFVFDCGKLVGCSGGVFSLVSAALSDIILNWKEDKAVLVKINPNKAPYAFAGKMLRILKLTALMAFACVSFGSAAVRRYNQHDIGVSMVNHIFGALTGFFAGFNILRDSKEDWWEKHLKFFCWSVFCVGFGLALGVNIFASRRGVGFWSWWEVDEEEDEEVDGEDDSLKC